MKTMIELNLCSEKVLKHCECAQTRTSRARAPFLARSLNSMAPWYEHINSTLKTEWTEKKTAKNMNTKSRNSGGSAQPNHTPRKKRSILNEMTHNFFPEWIKREKRDEEAKRTSDFALIGVFCIRFLKQKSQAEDTPLMCRCPVCACIKCKRSRKPIITIQVCARWNTTLNIL